MPRIVTQEEIGRSVVRKGFYPWAEWLDGQAREFIAGEDFTCSLVSFDHAVRNAVARRGILVNIRRTERGVIVESFPPSNGHQAS
jgi:hypothetical protein